ncbi:aromatic ring-hydroxylating oxygenase subunit alpha [Mycolicibacter kumamotonensis]|uniref:(2Fe-2S)-binding protein n=1 Tax=Mycolicibacter kumamotonensis TaxID=354243 RepID=A0A1B8S9C2_9MYCO|nr:aromatic ring-hydroxylating dioxygenase subunit alpha [Mycolicibacter kumamotonensis]OBY29320.1 (2Fe-2S)-binding protein [Mycolicibacter kumamotonensis]
MHRDQLIDLAHRALKLARDKTTDLAPTECTVRADTYTSTERATRDKAMLMTGPQLVGFASELPKSGSYCTKTVMGRSILLTRTSEGGVKAFDNVCLHRQSPIVSGCGTARRFACPYHAWTYDLNGNLVGVPGKEGFPETRSNSPKLNELPATEYAGFLWLALDPDAELDIAAHLGPLADELESWGVQSWSPVGEKVLDAPINWKLALDTYAENYHIATVHKTTFANIGRSNCLVFDSFGPHNRLVEPFHTILELDNVPEEQWEPLENMAFIYQLFPNIVLNFVLSSTLGITVCEIFRVYPGDVPGQSVTVQQNATPLNLSDESIAAVAQAAFDFTHAAVRDQDYPTAAGVQANLESPSAREHLVFGRNEPGLQHRHLTWAQAIGDRVEESAVS